METCISLNSISDKKHSDVLSEIDKDMVYPAVQLAEIQKTIADTGYSYDPRQDIFYSMLDPWQKKLGYCSLYDEASAPLGMLFDCEPVRFKYGGKYWLIELWKGQYGITTGGEIGVYTTMGPSLNVPGIFDGTFYTCADDIDQLSMAFTLLKNDEVMFSRAARHWWLTGFRLGDYADPSDLTMEASITFADAAMRDAFLEELYNMGYSDKKEVKSGGNTVLILFKEPHSKQPFTSHGIIGHEMKQRLKNNVAYYKKIAGGMNNVYDIIMAMKELPQMWDMFLKMGRNKELFSFYEIIKEYLS